MCGIVGFNWNDSKLLKKLNDLLNHRGPNQEGYFEDEMISLGHKRLSIIDLSKKGIQPMSDKDKKIIIIFNGEIFNYKEIRVELERKGVKFRSNTDTEVLLYGYMKYGKEILKKLNGQFAFCIYDKNKSELFLARDRFGINPLYYYSKNGKFIFGSELKVILKSGLNKEMDIDSLNFYLMFGYMPRKKTILKNTFSLEPGNYLIYDLKNKKIKKKETYWKPKFETKNISEEKAKKILLEKLDLAVKKRMVGDVPVGAFLSGGVDSSAIVAIMSKYTKNLNTFSIKFDYGDFDESNYAEIISKKFKTKHHVITFTVKDIRKLINKLPYHYDEPFADHSMIPTYLVSQVARKYVTVSLSGDGGDELFGGYTKYRQFQIINYQNIPLINKSSQIASKILKKPLLLHKYFLYSNLKPFEQYANLCSYRYINNLTKKDFKIYKDYEKYFKNKDMIKNMIKSDYNIYLPQDILNKVDRAALANSLETRPPFLDHELVEFANELPSNFKIKNGEKKYILKKALEEILPKEIIYRKKKGFGSPIKYYLKNELKDIIEKYVLNYNKHEYFENYDLNKIWSEYVNDKVDHSRFLWSLLMFNLWYEMWFITE